MTKKEIEERAAQLLEDVLQKYYSREKWDNRSLQAMIDDEMVNYSDDIAKGLEAILSATLAKSFTKSIPTVMSTPVQLSNMLYRNGKKVSIEAYAVIKQSIKARTTSYDLAMKLYDGYRFKDEAVLDVYEKLPLYMKRFLKSPKNQKEIYSQIAKMKTKPLRAATIAVTKAAEEMNDKALNKALEVVIEEKSRYYAYRIAASELQRAKSLADAKDMIDDGEIELIKFELSSLHKIYDICDAFANADVYGYGKGIYPKDKFPALGLHPHCLPGDALISSSSPISNMFRRAYEGDMYRINTKSGREITCTPNHPIMIDGGFISPNLLNIGDKIACEVGDKWVLGGNPLDDNSVTRIDDLFESSLMSSGMSTIRVPVSAEHFHHDGIIDTEVDIINTDGLLRDNTFKVFDKISINKLLVPRCYFSVLFDSLRVFKSLFSWNFSTSHSIMGSLDIRRFFLFGEPVHPVLMNSGHTHKSNPSFFHPFSNKTPTEFVLFGEGKNRNIMNSVVFNNSVNINNLLLGVKGYPSVSDNTTDNVIRYPQLSSDIINGTFGDSIFMDDIINIDVFFWSGHVYNLENKLGYYTCNGIITHNCKCKGTPYYRNKTKSHNQDGMRKHIESLTKEQQRDILGSFDKVKEFKEGKSSVAIWDSVRGKKYKIVPVAEVLESVRKL